MRKWVEDLARLLGQAERRGDDYVKRGLQNLTKRNPALLAGANLLFEQGDPIGTEAALMLARLTPVPGVVAFGQSERGTVEQRIEAQSLAVEHGLLPPGTPMTLYKGGEQTSVIPLAFEISFDPPVLKGLSDEARTLFEYAVDALQDDVPEETLDAVEQALMNHPDHPALLYYKQAALRMLGRSAEANEMLRHNFAVNPDYILGQLDFAKLRLFEGCDLEEAQAAVDSVIKQQTLHLTEYAALVEIQALILLRRGLHEGAISWMEMLEGVDPQKSPPVDHEHFGCD